MEPDWERKQRTSSLIAQVLTTIVRLYLPGRQLSQCGRFSGRPLFHLLVSGPTSLCQFRDFKPFSGPEHRIRCASEKGEEIDFKYVHILERLTILCRNNEWEIQSIRWTLCGHTNLLRLNLGLVRQGQVTFQY